MKKILFVIGLTICSFAKTYAQNKIELGIKGGVNFSNMTSDSFAENDNKTGFHIGVLAEIPFGNKFSVQPELLYSSQGTKAKLIMYGGGPMPSEYSLDYIQIPVLAKIYIIQNLSVEIGPTFSFLVNDNEKTNSIKNTDIGNIFEFGGAIGASYKIKFGLFGSLRYVHGFTVALDRENHIEDAKNRGFQLGLGYMFWQIAKKILWATMYKKNRANKC